MCSLTMAMIFDGLAKLGTCRGCLPSCITCSSHKRRAGEHGRAESTVLYTLMARPTSALIEVSLKDVLGIGALRRKAITIGL